jgi:CheY-like chemotaxis protein
VLAAGVAHDFNNLLASVLGSASLAQADLAPDAPVRQHLQRIELAARRGSDLTRQMLAYAGRGDTTPVDVDVNAVVEEMRDLLGVTLPGRIELRYELTSDIPAIEVDPTQLRQVVMNLVINAAEAIGDAGGVVTVRTGIADVDVAELAELHHGLNAAPGPHFFLEIADSGCGMDPATASRIFDPFFSTKFAGRGLGLATVAGIVRRHRGALGLRSVPGAGTTFRVLLPCRPHPALLDVAQDGPTPEARSDVRTILLVDDEEDVRAVTSHMLERLGCRVLLAGDGREAVDVFRAHARIIDAVLIDLTLPRVSGDQAAREIRGIRPDAPVILMSGYGEESAAQELAGVGSAAFLRKPFSVADLGATMGRALAPSD